ncbi:MAG: hypothetical protein NTW27_09825, partial [Deltaproteobacteria bacterium]|nr:hypothetical protein [Deltaproteobacteria bacterium]
LKLGAVKQSLELILSIPKGCAKFLLAIGVPLPMVFFKNGYGRNADCFKVIHPQFQTIDPKKAKL